MENQDLKLTTNNVEFAQRTCDEYDVGHSQKRPWGCWHVLDKGDGFRVKKLEVEPGKRLSLQSHNHRNERWIVVRGKLRVELDDQILEVAEGDMIMINKGQKHRPHCISQETAVIVEVWSGEYLGEDDIIRYEDDYGRK